MKQYSLIQFLKGFSIFTIVIYHFLQHAELPYWLELLSNFGGTGVHLFILISGLGLYLSHQKKPLGFVAFFKKRFSKIYLPYILIVLISAAISAAYPLYPNSWEAVLSHIFLYKMFVESFIGSYGYHLWFISMIFQFYLVFKPLCYLRAQIGSNAFLVFGFTVSILYSIVVLYLDKTEYRTWNSFFLAYLWEFCLGMHIAFLLNSGNTFQKWTKPWSILLAAIVLGVGFGLMSIAPIKGIRLFNDYFALPSYSLLAIFIYLKGGSIIKNFILITGKYSYSLYLIHFVILLSVLALPIGFWYQFSIGLLTCVILTPLYTRLSKNLFRIIFEPKS